MTKLVLSIDLYPEFKPKPRLQRNLGQCDDYFSVSSGFNDFIDFYCCINGREFGFGVDDSTNAKGPLVVTFYQNKVESAVSIRRPNNGGNMDIIFEKIVAYPNDQRFLALGKHQNSGGDDNILLTVVKVFPTECEGFFYVDPLVKQTQIYRFFSISWQDLFDTMGNDNRFFLFLNDAIGGHIINGTFALNSTSNKYEPVVENTMQIALSGNCNSGTCTEFRLKCAGGVYTDNGCILGIYRIRGGSFGNYSNGDYLMLMICDQQVVDQRLLDLSGHNNPNKVLPIDGDSSGYKAAIFMYKISGGKFAFGKVIANTTSSSIQLEYMKETDLQINNHQITLSSSGSIGKFAIRAKDGKARILVFNHSTGDVLKLINLKKNNGNFMRIIADQATGNTFLVYMSGVVLYKSRFDYNNPTMTCESTATEEETISVSDGDSSYLQTSGDTIVINLVNSPSNSFRGMTMETDYDHTTMTVPNFEELSCSNTYSFMASQPLRTIQVPCSGAQMLFSGFDSEIRLEHSSDCVFDGTSDIETVTYNDSSVASATPAYSSPITWATMGTDGVLNITNMDCSWNTSTPTLNLTFNVDLGILGGSVAQLVNVEILVPANSPPTVTGSLSNIVKQDNETFSEDIDLSSLCSDSDTGQTLSYSAAKDLSSIDASVSGTTLTISGTVPEADVGVHRINVTCSDGIDSAETHFNLTIENNAAPVISPSYTWSTTGTEGSAETHTFEAFTDPDGDAITYTIKYANNSDVDTWVSLDNATRVLSYTIPTPPETSYSFTLYADDGLNPKATASFTLNVNSLASMNNPPTVVGSLSDFTKQDNETFSEDIDLSGLCADSDTGQTLTYSAAKSLTSIDATVSGTTLTVNGTVSEADVGSHQINVTCADPYHNASTSFNLIIESNTAPVAPSGFTSSDNGVEGISGTHTFEAFTDPDGDAITYTIKYANGSNVDAWVNLDNATRVLSFTPPASPDPSYSFTLYADDGLNVKTTESFTLNVITAAEYSNNPPTVVGSLNDFIKQDNETFSEDIDLNGLCSDVDSGQTLTYSVAKNLASIDATVSGTTLTVSGTVPEADSGSHQINVTCADPYHNATTSFNLIINNNNAPTVPASFTSSANGVEGDADTHTFELFTDPDGDSITYSIKYANDTAVDSWVSLDNATRVLSYTPPADPDPNYAFTLSADDGFNPPTTVTFTLNVASLESLNNPPTVVGSLSDFTKQDNETFSEDIDLNGLCTDVDTGQSMTYSVAKSLSSIDATISGTTLTVSGTVPEADVGSHQINVTCADPYHNATTSFNLIINNNIAPAVPVSFTSTGSARVGLTESHTFEAFTDADGDSIDYSIEFSNSTAIDSSWLSFSNATRTLTFTPPSNANLSYSFTLTAADNLNADTTQGFTLVVHHPPEENTTITDRSREFKCRAATTVTLDGGILFDNVNAITSYSFMFENGTAAPSWIELYEDPNNSTDGDFYFNGTYPHANETSFTFTITATNNETLSADADWTLTTDCTDIKVVVNDTATDQNSTVLNSSFEYDVNTLFESNDASSALTFSATLEGGGSLPTWITLNANNTFTINPTTLADVNVTVKATNTHTYFETQTFNVKINNTTPVLDTSNPLGSISEEDNITFTWTRDLNGLCTDSDPNQVITYSVDTSPSFVTTTIHPNNTLEVNGNATDPSDITSHSLVVNCTDSFSSTQDNLTIVITENYAPSPPSLTPYTAKEDVPASTTLPAFSDMEGNSITYRVEQSDYSPLDTSWIEFDPATRILNYTVPANLGSGTVNLKYIATDNHNPDSETTVTLNIKYKPKDNPAVTFRTGTMVALSHSTFNISKNILIDDAAIISYWYELANGDPIPSWLDITNTSTHFLFNGTYPTFSSQDVDVNIFAQDVDGLIGYATITISPQVFCHGNCDDCNGPAIDDCISCYDGRFLYLSVCKLTCPDGYYGDSSDNTCKTCDPACKTCTGATNADCNECQQNATHTYYSFEGVCSDTCPTKYYGNTVSQTCESCHTYCTECYGSKSTECTDCDAANRYTLVSPDTCVYVECPGLTYYDNATNSCLACATECKNCYGPNSNDCIDCPYSRFLNTLIDACETCAEINSGLVFEPLSNTCLESCGKGFNLGFLECDDGNSLEGDGCDTNCKVENDWVCSGGTPTTPDNCYSLIGPECELTYISSSSHMGSIACSEPVTFHALAASDLEVEIDGPLAPYEFNYFINDSTGYVEGQVDDKFKVQFEFLSSLAGSNQETVTIKFLNSAILTDSDGNELQTKEISKEVPFFLVVLSEEEKAAASTQSNAGLFTMLLTFGTSTFISVALGGTVEATWLLLGTIQLMSFVPLFNLNLPGNFRQFSKNLAVLHGEPGALPNIFEGFVETDHLEPYNDYFNLMGFTTEVMLLNSGRKILLWGLMFSMMGVTFVLYDMMAELPFLGNLVRKIDVKIRYGILIRSVSQFYLSFALCAILNMYTLSWSGDIDLLSNLSAMVGMLVIIWIPIKSFNIIYKCPDLNSREFKKRYKTIVAGLKTSAPLCYQFICVFYFRRAIYAGLFVLFKPKPAVQIVFANISSIAMCIYVIIVKPYDTFLSTMLSTVNEILLVVMIAGVVRFLDPVISPSQSKMIGTAFVGIVIGTIIINWGSIIIFGIKQFIQVRRKKKLLKKYKGVPPYAQ